jgi:hypothetical protein
LEISTSVLFVYYAMLGCSLILYTYLHPFSIVIWKQILCWTHNLEFCIYSFKMRKWKFKIKNNCKWFQLEMFLPETKSSSQNFCCTLMVFDFSFPNYIMKRNRRTIFRKSKFIYKIPTEHVVMLITHQFRRPFLICH